MFRFKLLAAVVSMVVALAEELSLIKAESPAPKIEETALGWPPEEESSHSDLNIPSTPATFTVTATVYHPEPGQTDATPFITADGSRINKRDPKKHRWIAVSRDLHSRWGGQFSFGDSLWVTGVSEQLDGLYVVRDVMNKRMRSRIDILVGRQDRIMGLWKDVHIAKLN
ncbi:MAG: hypothetical protein LPK07_16770 [Hymenobacteraceae bacterium]|nr:hypothetical protein [Hymenobacteraceae bacterium]MDX5483336.1 hypothetical protein [Hymenobacteraceae bacterium]